MANLRKLVLARDDQSQVTGEIPWAALEQSYKIKLALVTEETLAVPAWAFRFKFTVATGVVWCGHGTVPLVAATNVWANELSEPNPIIRSVFDSNGDRIETLRFLSETADAFVHVIFYNESDGDLQS